MNCDMCGKESQLYKAEIEGTLLNLCTECAKMGKIIGTIAPPPSRRELEKKKKESDLPAYLEDSAERIQVISPDYARLVKNARERLGLKQEDFAKNIAEKESLIHSIETGRHEPSIPLARKLEKALRITLVETHEEKHGKLVKAGTGPLTIGDVLIKKK